MIDQPFHVDHVQPAIELESDLAKVPHLFESKTGVQPDAGLVGSIDGRNDGMESAALGGNNQRFEQAPSQPAPSPGFRNVNGVLRRESKANPIVVLVQRTPSHNLAVFRFGHEDGEIVALVRIEPVEPLLKRPWLVVIGGRGVQDGIVVDRQDRRTIPANRTPDSDRGS